MKIISPIYLHKTQKWQRHSMMCVHDIRYTRIPNGWLAGWLNECLEEYENTLLALKLFFGLLKCKHWKNHELILIWICNLDCHHSWAYRNSVTIICDSNKFIIKIQMNEIWRRFHLFIFGLMHKKSIEQIYI